MNNLKQIPQGNYEGYIWMSDQKNPEILNGETFDFSRITTNPFIIEALLFDKENNKSIHIRHTGKYYIHTIDLNNLPQDSELVETEYLPHRLENVKKVCFKELWVPEDDPLCEGWPVLTMKALIFVGFDNCHQIK